MFIVKEIVHQLACYCHAKNLPFLSKITKEKFSNYKLIAFSLVEMLMALLVASLLMAALAPVMTKKMGETVNINANMNSKGATKIVKEIEFNSVDCPEDSLKTDSDGSQYCEGEFEVPGGYNGMMKVTVVGAGGGGAAASTAGYTEYTTIGETNNFKVPYAVNEIEATLISGGAGGGAGHQVVENVNFSSSDGKFNWTPVDIVLNKYVHVIGCGGGGGGAGQRGKSGLGLGGGGGSGAYGKLPVYVANKNPWEIHIGGGGGGGSCFSNIDGKNGGYFAGGGGGGGTNGVTSLGYGGGAGTAAGGAGGKAFATGDYTNPLRNGENAIPAGGGAGGAGTTAIGDSRRNTGAGGGAGGLIAGGGGGGGVEGNAAGGGGGGATRLIINNITTVWPGGGGGGSSSGCNTSDGRPSQCYIGGAGGGGGGIGGGKGADAIDTWYGATPLPPHRAGNPGFGGYSNLFRISANGNGPYGGVINVNDYAFDDNCCYGGDSYYSNADVALGQNGKHGAIKISYLDYGVSGGGGGGAGIVPLRKVAVTPGETLKIKVGRGGKGGTTGYMKDDGTIKEPTTGEDAFSNSTERGCVITNISRNNTGEILLTTSFSTNYAGPLAGASGSSGPYNLGGSINDGKPTQPGANGAITVVGFTNTNGVWYNTKKSLGGAGGSATSPFTGTCTPGRGGTEASPDGTNGTGYGCGGGGGYSYYGNGGAGSGGYARISWNKYFDTAKKTYKLANTGAGGGGASGNVFTYNIEVRSNQILKFRIGKGGSGGNGSFAFSNNADDIKKLNGTKGGDTVFAIDTTKQVSAGGGGGGIYPEIKNVLGINKYVNGVGGLPSNVCSYNSKNYSNTAKYCTKGAAGNDAVDNAGGAGANLKSFVIKIIDSAGNLIDKQITGTGGIGGASSYGGHSENSYGAGGGGAGLWDLGEVNSNSASNPSKGGNGSNGKIILEWWE